MSSHTTTAPRKAPRWYYAYILLAVFDVLTVSTSLFLSHSMVGILRNSVAVNTDWAERQAVISGLRVLATNLNAPGNDVFDGGDVDKQERRLATAAFAFRRAVTNARSEISAHVHGSDRAGLLGLLDRLDAAAGQMTRQASELLSLMAAGKPARAAQQMAVMDRTYGVLGGVFAETDTLIRRVQNDNLAAQGQQAEDLRRVEFLLAGAIILLVLGATWYGSRTFLQMTRDARDREVRERELKATRDQALAAARAKSEFLARMSHEIRTPMNGVLGMAELLDRTTLETRQRQYLATIRQSADGLLAVINDILDFSKIESGKMELDDAPFSLEEVVGEAAELLAERAHNKGLELICRMAPELAAVFRGDAVRLRQILINLVGNAVKFTEHGHVVVRVAGIAHPDETRALLRFSVEDTGIGIRQESQRQIFDSFSQEDGSTTRRYGGTGLGLSISRQLVELMGGQIGVQSTPGEGSTFWFTVSVGREAAPVAGTVIRSLDDRRILVVDDNETNREILREHLQAWQARVSEADSGPLALECLRQAAATGTPFDLVVLDYQMPLMSGMDVVRAARAEPALRDVRFLMLSSMSRVTEDADGQSPEVAGWVTKPVRRTQLYTTLINLLADRPSETQRIRILKPQLPDAALELGLHVLLVEDNAVNQEVARAMLEQLRCAVTLASDGVEGVEQFQRSTFDVVLMDCQMPVLDGYGATRRIRVWEAECVRSHTPVVALTANALSGDRDKCLAAGMDAYLSKPFTLQQLRVTLEAVALAGPVGASRAGDPPQSSLALDPRALEQLRALQGPGSPDLVERVIALFIDSSKTLTTGIHAAFEAGNATALREAAHALKSSSGNVGATGLAEIAGELEALGLGTSPGAAAQLVDRMFQEHLRVINALKDQRRAA